MHSLSVYLNNRIWFFAPTQTFRCDPPFSFGLLLFMQCGPEEITMATNLGLKLGSRPAKDRTERHFWPHTWDADSALVAPLGRELRVRADDINIKIVTTFACQQQPLLWSDATGIYIFDYTEKSWARHKNRKKLWVAAPLVGDMYPVTTGLSSPEISALCNTTSFKKVSFCTSEELIENAKGTTASNKTV